MVYGIFPGGSQPKKGIIKENGVMPRHPGKTP
jgi:hypothetical protein